MGLQKAGHDLATKQQQQERVQTHLLYIQAISININVVIYEVK